jgi:predicted nucleic acid-binding protein
VLVSALIADGPASRLLEEAIDGRIELLLPELVLAELNRVLREKLGFDEERARAACQLLARSGALRHADAGSRLALRLGNAVEHVRVEIGAGRPDDRLAEFVDADSRERGRIAERPEDRPIEQWLDVASRTSPSANVTLTT